MDTLLMNGDWAKGETGLPLKISGYRELLQRVIIRLNVPKGSFLYDKNFGCRFSELKKKDKGTLDVNAMLMAQEALSDMRNVRVKKASVNLSSSNIPVSVMLTVIIDSTEGEVMVAI